MIGLDFALFTQSIKLAGAGIASILVNVQIVVLPVLGLILYRERLRRQYVAVVPLMFVGIALAAGVAETGGHQNQLLYGAFLAVTAGVAYSVYLFIVARVDTRGRAGTQVFVTTVVSGIVGSTISLTWGGIDLAPGWQSLAWLAAMALGSSVIGWILIGRALYRLPADVGAAILLLQPVISLVLAIGILAERPSVLQLCGCAIVVVAIWFVGRKPGGHGVDDVADPTALGRPPETGPTLQMPESADLKCANRARMRP